MNKNDDKYNDNNKNINIGYIGNVLGDKIDNKNNNI